MVIHFDSDQQVFHLQGKDTSYCMQIVGSGFLTHLYWGKKITSYHGSNPILFANRRFSPNPDPSDRTFSLDTLPQEYPAYGNTDFRAPAYQIQLENGSTITDLRYKKYFIYKGKQKLAGLPATYIENDHEAESIDIFLEDSLIGLSVILTYTVFESYNVITRSVRFQNQGREQLKIIRALSANIDFRDDQFDFLTLYGAHINERNIERRPVSPGNQSIESRRGASSHQQNPFFALLRKDVTEDHGDVYGFSLVYSGNFLAHVEVDQFHTTRASIGLNPFDFSWKVEPGDFFQTPEVVLVYSSEGLGEMSRTYNELYRTRLCRGTFRDLVRPILLNNWEATYMKFTAEKIMEIAKAGKEVGIELFVLDDGWFGKRDNDKSSLGDWVVNKRKLPNGLANLADKILNLGMEFGLWFEPEMVSVDSDLYRDHPDWCLHVPNRKRSEGRNQLVLDLSRKEVCDYIIQAVSTVLASAPITYVKWDMNRHMTEIGSEKLPKDKQRETAHRYMLGLYYVLEKMITKFPHVLFESCSGGGGRFDPGMLYYMPQTWTSDNTDAISRLKIQYGTSLVYPVISMCSHVSSVPNHQVQRVTSLAIRGHVAMAGNLGYELDLTKLSPQEKDEIKQQINLYKEIRHVVQFGDFYRLLNPFEGNESAWMFVSKDKSEVVMGYFKVLAEPNAPFVRLQLKGLNPDFLYKHIETGKVYGGDELLYVGIALPMLKGDFTSVFWRFRTVEIHLNA
ncbi:alpha-galactosidase [Neobacillus sp. PS3-40]|uniref:alpha-galactosidase n=1 Tax=Neobacillus sp. PS3-40 TaxID=3070679 RepID=UPI0027E110BA|nr:alpha-galactosidase [Neobacillus sp. PS3-40]WML43149.1 alpha-galactosidase [Neobacillus sp. PS3-40]